MDIRNWFYRQIVTQAQMDEAFGWAEDADHNYVVDSNLSGLIRLAATEWDSQPTTPASLGIGVEGGPHRAYSKAGERIYFGSATESIDCSVDEYGVSTTVTTGGNSRWVSVFARFKRRLTDPEVDGSSVLVYTREYEDAELFVRQGAEAVTPVKPTLLTDALLVCDINISYAQTTIQSGHIFISRTEWWFSKTGMTTLSDQVAGNVKVVLDSLWDELDIVAGGGGPFAFTSTWFGSSAVGGGTPATFAEALDAIVNDLSVATGSTLVGTPNVSTTYVSWTGQSITGALSAIATAVSNHIGGAAPQHPAAGITFDDSNVNSKWGLTPAEVQAAIDDIVDALDSNSSGDGSSLIGQYSISGSPESFSTNNVYNCLSAIYGHLNDRTERSTDEVVDADWVFTGQPIAVSMGIGGGDPEHEGAMLCIDSYSNQDNLNGVSHPAGPQSFFWVGTDHSDPCSIMDPDKPGRYLLVLTAIDGSILYKVNPETLTYSASAITGLAAGVTEISSTCSDGVNLCVAVRRSGGNDSIAKIEATSGNVIWESNLSNATAFAGYPLDRIKVGDVITTSPWAVELLVLCGALDPAVSGVVEKWNSNTGVNIWAAAAATLTGKVVQGGLACNSDLVCFTTNAGDATVPKIGCITNSTGIEAVSVDMATSGSSNVDASYDLLYDGRRFVWVSRSGYVRFWQPYRVNYWYAILLNDNTMAVANQGFSVGFDGRNIWVPSPDNSTVIIDLYRSHAADSDFNSMSRYQNVIQNSNSWAPLAPPWQMGRGCQVGPHYFFSMCQPTASGGRNSVFRIWNANGWQF